MNNKKYVLKQRSFMFNDSDFSCIIDSDYGACHALSLIKDEIMLLWQTLEYKYAYENDYLHIIQNESNLLECKSVKAFALEHKLDINQPTVTIDGVMHDVFEEFIRSLSPEKLLPILIEQNSNLFRCIEVSQEQIYYALWDSYTQQYEINDCDYDELVEPQKFISKSICPISLVKDFVRMGDFPYTMHGSLAELSSSPLLLGSVIQQFTELNFEDNQLIITAENPQAILALNDLLKKPLFELKKISIEEIFQIEKELNPKMHDV